MDYKINPKLIDTILSEPVFELFKHEDLWCVIQRHNMFGNFLGYVAVDENHPCYNLSYDGITSEEFNKQMEDFLKNKSVSNISQPTAYYNFGGIKIQEVSVHGGLTYASGRLNGIADDVLGKLWWFGFDTLHAGDTYAYINAMTSSLTFSDSTYKNFEYTKIEVKSLAEQLQQIHKDYVNKQ